MKYKNICEGIFIRRINRFIAEVKIDEQIERVHVKNTGRCRELFIEGRKVYLESSDNQNRKTRYSLISIYKGDMLVNIDSQVPNAVVYDALVAGSLNEFKDMAVVRREKTYGNSRFDIYYQRKNGREGYIEVKGATLEDDGRVMFPDAPTERGCKHVTEMTDAVKNGYEGTIFFLIQMDKAVEFKPNAKTDPEFAKVLSEAYGSGVNILVYTSAVTKDSIEIKEKLSRVMV